MPPASSIISGTQWPPAYGGSSHSSATTRGRWRSGNGLADAVEPRLKLAAQRLATVSARRVASASRTRSSSTSPRRLGVERDHARARLEPRGDRADVVVGDGADRAQRLGDDQVGLEVGERGLVELVERLAPPGDLAHAGVDLAGLQAGRDHAARQAGQAAGPRPGGRTRA